MAVRFAPLALFLALPACGTLFDGGSKAAVDGASPSTKSAPTNAAADALKGRIAQTSLKVAEKKLAQAKLQAEAELAAKERDLAFSGQELQMARAKLELYTTTEMPNKLAQAKLDLQRMRDNAQERADELAQIEIMYDESEIDDKTKEFVLQRGKRQAEASTRQLEIAERNFEVTEKHDLPREKARLELEVAKKASELEKAKAALEADRLEREIRLLNAGTELEKAQNEIQQAAGEAK